MPVTLTQYRQNRARSGNRGMMMLAAARRAEILEMLRRRKAIRSEEVAASLGVSVETVRRDLEHLDHAGELVRVHGGAVPVDVAAIAEPPFEARTALAAESKQAIGRAAADLVRTARTVFLDVGTTAMQVANSISSDAHATIITPSFRVAEILAKHPSITVMVPGGVVRNGDLAISGATAVDFLRDISPDVALLGSGGLTVERGLTDFELAEIPLKRVALRNSARVYVLADSTKIGVVAPYRVCDLSEVTGVVTDAALSPQDGENLTAAGLEIVTGG